MKEKYVHFREPTLTRKTFKKNSIISWSETGLGVLCYQKLQAHMDGLRDELYPLFEKNRELFPRKSVLHSGGVHGCWIYCPNAIADQVEAIVKRRHDEYRAANYNEIDLFAAQYKADLLNSYRKTE